MGEMSLESVSTNESAMMAVVNQSEIDMEEVKYHLNYHLNR